MGDPIRTPRNRRPDWKPRFLELMAATGNVHLAAKAVGIDRSTPYQRASRDPAFARAWAQAREDAIDTLEAEGRRRALGGSDPLLMFFLRALRPEVYRDTLTVRVDIRAEAERMAERLGCSVAEVLAVAERKAREVLGP